MNPLSSYKDLFIYLNFWCLFKQKEMKELWMWSSSSETCLLVCLRSVFLLFFNTVAFPLSKKKRSQSPSLIVLLQALVILATFPFLPPRMWSSICCAQAQSTAWRAPTLCHPCRSAPAPRVARSTVWQTAQMTAGRWPWCRRESTPSPPTALSCTSPWSVQMLTLLWVDVLFKNPAFWTPIQLNWMRMWPICWRVLGLNPLKTSVSGGPHDLSASPPFFGNIFPQGLYDDKLDKTLILNYFTLIFLF